jgi:hypothetical protein
MASKQLTLNKTMVVEPKAKKEKEKDAAFKELVTIGKAMVEGDLLENKA